MTQSDNTEYTIEAVHLESEFSAPPDLFKVNDKVGCLIMICIASRENENRNMCTNYQTYNRFNENHVKNNFRYKAFVLPISENENRTDLKSVDYPYYLGEYNVNDGVGNII